MKADEFHVDDCASFPDVLVKGHAHAFTGPMLLHWAQGHIVIVDLPREPTRKKLDTGGRRRRLDSAR